MNITKHQINDITKLFSQVNKLEKIIDYGEAVELEARIGTTYNRDKFTPGITCSIYNRIYRYLCNNSSECDHDKKYQTIYHGNGIRKIVTSYVDKSVNNIKNITHSKEQELYEKKENIDKYDILNYCTRFSLSKETTLNKNSISISLQDTLVLYRTRCRDTFKVNDEVYIDLDVYLNPLDDKMYYSCEVEFRYKLDTNNAKRIQIALYEVSNILMMVQNSELLIDTVEHREVANQYSSLTKKNYFIGNQPETISLKKLKENISTSYAITEKLDGERSLLFINNKGMTYLINNRLKITRYNLYIHDEKYRNTIIDGEYFNGHYYAFDIIYIHDQDLYNNISYGLCERLDILKSVIDVSNFKFINNTSSRIYIKQYCFDTLYNSFKKLTKKYENELNTGIIDGLIIVGVDHPYSKKNVPYKWKPSRHNTIDFEIRKTTAWGDESGDYKWDLYCSDNTIFPVDKYKSVKVNKETDDTYDDKSIVEFRFDKNLDCFIAVRKREDKIKGNYLSIAMDNWDTIQNPFEIEELKDIETNKETDSYIPSHIKERLHSKAVTFYNMRRFHNWVKRVYLVKYSNMLKYPILLDLACGKGGDLKKWMDCNFKYVEGYDICNDSILEAKNRHIKLQERDRVKTEVLLDRMDLSKTSVKSGKEFDIITCHFAVHYFFESKDKLDMLIKSIVDNSKDGTICMISFMNGNRVKDFIDKGYSTEDMFIKYSNAESKSKGKEVGYGKEVDVYLKDSVLDKPTKEYIVNEEVLIKSLSERGINLKEVVKFKDLFKVWAKLSNTNGMTIQERNMSFLNEIMIFRVDNSNNRLETRGAKQEEDDDVVHIKRTDEPNKEESCLKKWKLNELKEYCRDKQLVIKGNKEQLIERILKYKKDNSDGKVL